MKSMAPYFTIFITAQCTILILWCLLTEKDGRKVKKLLKSILQQSLMYVEE